MHIDRILACGEPKCDEMLLTFVAESGHNKWSLHVDHFRDHTFSLLALLLRFWFHSPCVMHYCEGGGTYGLPPVGKIIPLNFPGEIIRLRS